MFWIVALIVLVALLAWAALFDRRHGGAWRNSNFDAAVRRLHGEADAGGGGGPGAGS